VDEAMGKQHCPHIKNTKTNNTTSGYGFNKHLTKHDF
jgi:hypothetical protein